MSTKISPAQMFYTPVDQEDLQRMLDQLNGAEKAIAMRFAMHAWNLACLMVNDEPEVPEVPEASMVYEFEYRMPELPDYVQISAGSIGDAVAQFRETYGEDADVLSLTKNGRININLGVVDLATKDYYRALDNG